MLLALQLNNLLEGAGASPPVLLGNIPNLRERQDTGAHQLDVSQYFSGADTYAIDPAVETGWTFDTNTGLLTVDTDVASTFGPFTVTATNANGDTPSNAFSVEIYEVRSEGGIARRPRKRHLVEIDGEYFAVNDREEAEQLLRKALELAPQAVEQAVSRNIKRVKRGKQAVEIAAPAISTEAPELLSLVSQYRDDIEAIYKRMALDAEIRERLRLKLLQEDEDDAIAVLLLH